MSPFFEVKRLKWIFCFFVKLTLCLGKISTNMDPINLAQWNIPKDEAYSTIHQLTETNFYPKVINNADAWVVVIFKGKLHSKWIRHAEYLKGSVWYGSINHDKEEDLAKKWAPDLSEDKLKSGIALVFPYGKNKKGNFGNKKAQWPKQASEPKKMEEILKTAIPDHIKKFSFLPQEKEILQSWIIDSYYNKDFPRFPVLCITDEPEPQVPISLLSISMYFSNFFSFGLVRKSSVERMVSQFKQVPPPKTFPHYLILMGKEPSQEEMDRGSFGMSFNIFPFIENKYGDASHFLSVVKFLFTANEDYRDALPGRRLDESIAISKMTKIRDSLTSRLKIVSKSYKPKNKKTEL